MVRHALIGILSGGHVLLEGVPGLGKTMLIRTLGQALIARIQPHPVHARPDAGRHHRHRHHGRSGDGRRQFRFQQGPVFANLILADEINRATPKTQSALLEAMQEHTVTVANETYRLPEPFFVLATQNPIEQEGTYPLPEAQLDRFLFKINVGFPTAEELNEILTRTTGKADPQPETAASGQQISAMQAAGPAGSHRQPHQRIYQPPDCGHPSGQQPRRRWSTSTCATVPARAAARRWSWAPRLRPCWLVATM